MSLIIRLFNCNPINKRKSVYFPFIALYVWIFFVTRTGSSTPFFDKELNIFLSELEPYSNTKSEVVFVLDESGSIGADVFPHEVKFTELLARHLTVSSTNTRVAILTYSTGYISRLDYIRNAVDKNMCTFLSDLEKIDYKGGWTHTRSALAAAANILESGSRAGSNRIIILISDGQSTPSDGNPIPLAQDLKRKGIIMFSVGVASINKDELLAIASSPNHIYMLQNFALIERANEQLVNDTKELNWDKASSSSLCNQLCSERSDCCDEHASCMCGATGGRYECACQAGYSGGGTKGQCNICPVGTYKSKEGPDACTPCPSNSTTANKGSTRVDSCFCLKGYVGNPASGKACKPIECAKLSNPEGGTLHPVNCRNEYNSTCSFYCFEGYCPYHCNKIADAYKAEPWRIKPDQPRQCLETRLWSGEEFFCEKIRCPALPFPTNGNHNCSVSDFTFGTICEMACNQGFERQGSQIRECLINGSWTGEETICKQIVCPPLKTNKLLLLKPPSCSKVESPFKSICQYYCTKGYDLTSSFADKSKHGVRECLANGHWSNMNENLNCKDATPPNIQCPKSSTYPTDDFKPSARVFWDLPIVTDNLYANPARIIEPKHLVKPPHEFTIGETKVTYQTTDIVGLNATCSFKITVVDREPPRIISCPDNIEKYHNVKKGIAIKWKDPEFKDNSGKIKYIFQNKKSGDMFAWGPPTSVNYTAEDESGNNATCSFTVKVKSYPCPHYPPPTNGAIACDAWEEGRTCSVFCNDGYDFTDNVAPIYYCRQGRGANAAYWDLPPSPGRNKFIKFKLPWPDCGKITKAQGKKVALKLQYSVNSCPTGPEAQKELAEKFLKILKSKFPPKFCTEKIGCSSDNIKIKCGDKKSSTTRKKRQVPEEPGIFLDISLSVEVPQEETCDNCTEHDQDNGGVLPSIESAKEELLTNLTKLIQEALPELEPSVHISTIDMSSGCERGEILRKNQCISCPLGTYHDVTENACLRCAVGFYQDTESSESCKSCPDGTMTVNAGAHSVKECKALCLAGTYSSTGLESCISCPLGSYQPFYGQKECIQCESGKTTWTEGAKSEHACTIACQMGTYSSTGHEPCLPCPRGSYQPNAKQKECIACPQGLTTYVEGSHAVQFCRAINTCEELFTCENGGKCYEEGGTAFCKCPKGFGGEFCEENINDCTSDLCLNNGTCVDGVDGYSCICIPGFSGENCEKNIDDCVNAPCLNGGTCIDGVGGFACKCPEGLSGKHCEYNYPDCTSNPCQNGGTCFDVVSGYRCCCLKNYTGHNCESTFDPCENLPCLHNGTCIVEGDSYHCTCLNGYSGDICQNDIDDCASQPCMHGATCIDGVASFTCICPPVFTGPTCDTALPSDFILDFPTPLTSNYASLYNKHSLHAVTVSLWIKTQHKDNRGTPFSYSYKNPINMQEIDNALTLMDVNKLILFIHGKGFHTGIVANVDDRWHHIVVTWDSMNGDWAMYWDSAKKQSGTDLGKGQHLWPGYFVLAQEQDAIGGGFSAFESFSGEITEFNVWNFSMNDQDVLHINKMCGIIGNVIAWPDVVHNLHGKLVPNNQQKPCSVLGKQECSEDDCHCIKNAKKEGYKTCWRKVESCSECQHNHSCETTQNGNIVCKCSLGFVGDHCQYDVNECLVNKGNCSHLCENVVGSYRCSCPVGMLLLDDQHTCIDTGYCIVNDLIYRDGESWISACQKCICKKGLVTCTDNKCPSVSCQQGEIVHTSPDECCPKCIKEPKKCVVRGGNSFRTFDGAFYHFQGQCRYVLAEDCLNGEFSIHFESLGNKTTLSIYLHCINIVLNPFDGVTVDNQTISIPYHVPGLLHIEEHINSFFITTSAGVSVRYKMYESVEVFYSQSNRRQLCGLCGNSNGNITDDITTRFNLPGKTVEEFGHSWKVNSYRHCKRSTDPKQLKSGSKLYTVQEICSGTPYASTNQRYAFNACKALKMKPFTFCHKEVPLGYYYDMCIFDACFCNRKDLCYCDAYAGYALECRKKGIHIDPWTYRKKCQMRCQGNLIFQDYGSPCPDVCVAGKVVERQCPLQEYTPGCYCAAGMVLHNNTCISKEDCRAMYSI